MNVFESDTGVAMAGLKRIAGRLSRRSAVTPALFLLAGALHAQPVDYASLEELFGEPVTRSVTGSPQRASEVPASMIIVTAEDIRRSAARDIPGVLSRLAGIDVDRSTGEHADVAVRGYNEAFTPRLLVLVDGRQVYADYYGFTPWSTIPVELDQIRQIEVVKGPSGALFGFNAVGGVVNIVTYDTVQDDEASSVSMRAGTQDLRELSTVFPFRIGDNGTLRLSAGSRRSKEFGTARGPYDVPTDRDNARDAIGVDARFGLSPNVRLQIEATFSDVDQFNVPPSYVISFMKYETASLRARWEAETDLGLVQASVYRNVLEADVAPAAAAGVSEAAFDNRVLVAQLEDVFKVGTSHVLRIAGEVRKNTMPTTPQRGAEVRYDVVSLTSMWEWSVAPHVTITNAARFDDWHLGRDGYFPPGLGLTNDDWNVSRDNFSFNSGVVWAVSESDTLRILAGRAEQLPNLLELGGLFGDFTGYYFVGTPTLGPESVSSYELAWTRSGAIDFELNVFRGDTGDLHSLPFDDLGSSSTEGIEASVGGRFGEGFDWDVSALAQSIEDDLNIPALLPAGTTLLDYEHTSPDRVIKGHLGWTSGPIEVDAFLRYESDSAGLIATAPGGVTAGLAEIPGHVSLDASFGYRLGERWRLAVKGRNLTHSSQRQTVMPEVERQLFATAEFSF